MFKAAPVFLLLLCTCVAQRFELSTLATPKAAFCSPCVQLTGQGLNILVNQVLNAGIVGGCAELCGHLKCGTEQKVCDAVCDIAGMKAFVKALKHADLDPIYFCELIHACESGADNAHVDLLSVKLTPPSIASKDIQPGGSGVTIEGVLTVNVTQAIGVGQFAIDVTGPVQGLQGPVAETFMLADGLKEGVQSFGVKLNIADTQPDQPPSAPVTWNPGSYMFRFDVCQGECGSKHPHSINFGTKSANFTIDTTGKSIVV